VSAALSPAEQFEADRAATKMLDDPALREGFRRLEADIIDAWRNTSAADHDAREQHWLRLKALESMRQELQNMVEVRRLADQRRAGAR
jgi:hypothetical protein